MKEEHFVGPGHVSLCESIPLFVHCVRLSVHTKRTSSILLGTGARYLRVLLTLQQGHAIAVVAIERLFPQELRFANKNNSPR